MRPTDLPLLVSVGAPAVPPSGDIALVATSRPDLDADRNVGRIVRVSLEGERRVTPFTRGTGDRAPRFSPDGSLVAFLRPVEGSGPQVHVVEAGGGEPVVATDAPLGVEDVAFTADGTGIVFLARVAPAGRYRTVEGIGPDAEPPRRITRAGYDANGLGWRLDRPTQLFVSELPDLAADPVATPAPRVGDEHPTRPSTAREARQLTDGDADVQAFAVDPAGGRAIVSRPRRERDDDLVDDVIVVPLDGGASTPLGAGTPLGVGALGVLDGGLVVATAIDLGATGRDFVGRGTALWAWREADGGGRWERLTDPATTDLQGSEIVAEPGGGALVTVTERGTVQAMRVTPGASGEDARIERLSAGPLEIVGIGVGGGRIVFSYTDGVSAGEIGVLHGDDLDARTDLGAPLKATGLAPTRELVVTARDGHEVQGWVLTPEGDGPHPVLLMIHGGPFAQYGVHVFDEAQTAAAAGYAVVMCNPRGSAGYGEEHGRAIRRAMGTVDASDVLDVLDAAIASSPALDGDRVGIMGGSYGGYLTAWTIAHDHRFAAAIVERGFLDPVQFDGTSDIGEFFGQEYTGTDPDEVAAQSPQAAVGSVTTPTLVLHSELDLRCPLGQATRYWSSLRRQGVETELVVFPGENHELSRSGRPRHRLQRFEVVLDWWARHLPTEANPAPASAAGTAGTAAGDDDASAERTASAEATP